MSADKETLAAFAEAGIDHKALAGRLQRGRSRVLRPVVEKLLASIASKHEQLTTNGI